MSRETPLRRAPVTNDKYLEGWRLKVERLRFLSLLDTPSSHGALQFLRGNSAGDAVEYVTLIPSMITTTYHTPDSYVITVPASVTSGDIDSVKTPYDGDEILIDESVGVSPAISIVFNFSGITSIGNIVVTGYYDSTQMGHYVSIQLYDYNITDWVTIHTITPSGDMQAHYKRIPDDTNFISSGAAQVRLYHPTIGLAHELHIDYLALTN